MDIVVEFHSREVGNAIELSGGHSKVRFKVRSRNSERVRVLWGI